MIFKKGKRMKTIFIILLLLISSYFIIFLNTNSLMRLSKDIMLGKEFVEESNMLSEYSPKVDITYADVNINRLFVIHNFKHGYIWSIYSYRYYNDEKLVGSSLYTPTKWEIEKKNGKWVVIDIEEAP